MSIFNCAYRSDLLCNTHPFMIISPDPNSSYTIPGLEPRLIYALHGLGTYYSQMATKLPLEVMSNTFNITFVLPQGDRSFYVDGIYPYEKYITEELPAYLDRHFKLPPAENTSIMGISMGGYGAVNLYGRHPDLFHSCCAMSPAIDIEQMRILSRQEEWKCGKESEVDLLVNSVNDPMKLSFPSDAKISIYCGTEDPLFPGCQKFVNILKEKKVPAKVHFEEGNHDWFFWNKHLITAMQEICGIV